MNVFLILVLLTFQKINNQLTVNLRVYTQCKSQRGLLVGLMHKKKGLHVAKTVC